MALIFFIWWMLTAIVMIYLLINNLYLIRMKKKISEDRFKEIMCERNARQSRYIAELMKCKEVRRDESEEGEKQNSGKKNS